MSRQEVVGKGGDLMALVLGAERCGRLIDAAPEVDGLPESRALGPLLRTG